MEDDRTFDFDAPVSSYPEPDRVAAVLAHRDMLKHETPQRRYMRQQYETAMGATKVAMDAWRRIYPELVIDHMPGVYGEQAREAAEAVESCYMLLDGLGPFFHGETMRLVNAGYINEEDVRARTGQP